MKNQAQPRSVKTLKGQLFGAVAMIVVAAVALGTSTYAWFISNQTVEVETMQLQVSTSTSLLVALGKAQGIAPATGVIANWTGNKSIITNGDIDGTGATDPADWEDFFDNKMIPATITTANLTPTSPKFFMTDNHVTNGKLDQFYQLAFDTTKADSVGQGAVKRIPLRFTASNNMSVYFGKEGVTGIADLLVESTVVGEVNGKDLAAQRAAIAGALRVAVVPHDTATITNSPIRVFQFEAGLDTIATPGNNTDYNTQTPGLSEVKEPEGLYTSVAAAGTTTDAAVISSTGAMQTLVPSLSADTDAHNADKAFATWDATSESYTKPTANEKPLFELNGGEEREVDVYFWLEGTDKDCLNELSAYKFGLNLPFASVLPTPTNP